MDNGIRPISGRDPRLDFLRGLALITIFVNHVPGNVYENMTSRNFGFSDAAEGFVLMAGIAAGLAYTNAFVRSKADAIYAMLRRAAKLYGVHLASTVAAVLLLVWSQTSLGTIAMSERVNLLPFLNDPDSATFGFITLGHQLGYFNILPIYIVLIALCPLMLPLALHSRAVLLAVSFSTWLASGYFDINITNYPTAGGWFLNPFCWQLIFVIGLCVGVGLKTGRPLLPKSTTLVWLAGAYLLFAAYVVQAERFDLVHLDGLPAIIGGHDKGILPLPRLLHVLALAYLLCSISWLKSAASSRIASPIIALGRQSLAVFVAGSLISLMLQALKEVHQFSIGLDTVALGAGLAIQYLIALYCNGYRFGSRQVLKANQPTVLSAG